MSRARVVSESLADNQTYYFTVARGTWEGEFRFRIISWPRFRADRIGLRNRFLVYGMAAMQKLFGAARIDSRIEASPDEGSFGVARNRVRIWKFGVTLYLLEEAYHLNEDGSNVQVRARERFGPIPFLLRTTKEHLAIIHTDGMSSTYYIPLLGTDWTADYTVHADLRHIDGRLACEWAEAAETIQKVKLA